VPKLCESFQVSVVPLYSYEVTSLIMEFYSVGFVASVYDNYSQFVVHFISGGGRTLYEGQTQGRRLRFASEGNNYGDRSETKFFFSRGGIIQKQQN
jgi:hypothetical protein